MNELKNKKRYITITPKDSETILVNIGEETKEVLSWGLPFFSPNDVKSAVEGMYDEFTRAIMETSVLDPINIVRHFGDLQMKWFADAIDNDTKERVEK